MTTPTHPAALNETDGAMTAADLLAEVKSIAAIFGPNAYVAASISAGRHSSDQAMVCVFPDDITSTRTGEHFRAPTWSEALSAARTWSLSQGTVQREATIRRMALLIVDLTDQHGQCTEAMLMRKEFAREQVRELHAAACERAGEMCQGAPFSVMFG